MKRFARICAATLTILIATVSASRLAAQATGDSLLTPAQLREDVGIMRTALEESHAGLYWFITKSELNRRFAGVTASLNEAMSVRTFHRALLPLVASLRHGHTTLTWPTDADGYRLRALSRTGAYFPAEVRVIRDRLYVLNDLTADNSLAPGTEIVAINGTRITQLVTTMRTCLSADGVNDTFRLFQLGEGFQFNFLLDLLAGPTATFAVSTRNGAGAKMMTRTVSAQTPRQMRVQYLARTGHDIDQLPPAIALRFVKPHVAVLSVNSFYEGLLGNGSPGFAAEFAAAFGQIRDSAVTSLILDLRQNEGGNDDYVPLLYSYLADKPFRMASPTEVSSASLSWLRYADSPSDDVKAFAAAPLDFVNKDSSGTWLLKPELDVTRYRAYDPQPLAFTGQLIVLTSGKTFSAANAFVDLVHRFHRREGRDITFVGEQNGGDDSFGRVSGGQIVRLVLPNSREVLTIPLLGFRQYFGTARPKAVIPDHRIASTINDLVAGRDAPMRFAQSLVRQRGR